MANEYGRIKMFKKATGADVDKIVALALKDYKPELAYKLNINEVRQLEKMLRKDKIL